MKKVTSKLKPLLKRIIFAYFVICLSMYVLQRHLLYVPVNNISPPASYGLVDFSDLSLKASDGVNVAAWHRAAKEGFPTIIYFHGNGGNLSHRANFFSLLRDAGFGILALDYRGYGSSEGSPSEEGFYLDARATMDYAIKELGLTNDQIIIYGESIGTGVAVQMATEHKIAALILQAPFSSMTSAAGYHYPWLPVSILLKDRYDSIQKITNIHTPLLFLHGEKDTIVPIELGKKLYAQAAEPKQAVYFPENGHNDFDLQKLAETVLEFSRTHQLIR